MNAANLAICARCPQRALCRKFLLEDAQCEHWPAPLPGLPTLAMRAAKEVGTWLGKGAHLASEEVITQRRSICAACPHWDAEAFAGTGRCRHPACGCSAAKQRLATSRCPMGQWEAVKSDNEPLHT